MTGWFSDGDFPGEFLDLTFRIDPVKLIGSLLFGVVARFWLVLLADLETAGFAGLGLVW